MNIDFAVSIMFMFHVALLVVKIYASLIIFRWLTLAKAPNDVNYIFIFSAYELMLFALSFIFVIYEGVFLYTFFIEGVFTSYEYLSVTDQIVYTLVAVQYLKKERSRG